MPANQLFQQLEELRKRLALNPPLSDEERASLELLVRDIELQRTVQAASASDESLLNSIELSVERFEVSHPAIAGSLRNIVMCLANMGI
jgi:hypothetical protein